MGQPDRDGQTADDFVLETSTARASGLLEQGAAGKSERRTEKGRRCSAEVSRTHTRNHRDIARSHGGRRTATSWGRRQLRRLDSRRWCVAWTPADRRRGLQGLVGVPHIQTWNSSAHIKGSKTYFIRPTNKYIFLIATIHVWPFVLFKFIVQIIK